MLGGGQWHWRSHLSHRLGVTTLTGAFNMAESNLPPLPDFCASRSSSPAPSFPAFFWVNGISLSIPLSLRHGLLCACVV